MARTKMGWTIPHGVTTPIAFDASSKSATSASSYTDPITWTHTPVGTPKGVVVMIQVESGGDAPVTVTYGSSSCTEDTLGHNTGGEGGNHTQYLYFCGTGLPTGAQTVTVDLVGNAAAIGINCTAVTFTAGSDTVIHAHTQTNQSGAVDPVTTVATITKDSTIVGMCNSGQDTAGAVAANATSTLVQSIIDVGAQQHVFLRRTDNASVDATFGITQTAAAALMYGVAVSLA